MRRNRLTDRQRELIERVHEEAIRRGACRYVDPVTGQRVCTALHHRRRGHCCRSFCRHCPYPASERRAALRTPRRGGA